MKEITLQVFKDFDDAVLWMENEVWEQMVEHDDIKVEMVLIDGSWRVGVITNDRQKEFNFGTEV